MTHQKSRRQNVQGRVVAVSISDRKGVVKHNVSQAQLVVEHGLNGDAHAGSGRQVSLLSKESIDKIIPRVSAVSPVEFAQKSTGQGL